MNVSFTIVPDEAGERIDAVVTKRVGCTRNSARSAVQDGSVTVSGQRVKPSHRVEAGEVVEGVVADVESGPPVAEDIPVQVRYEDEHLMVINKPAGLVTHPATGHRSGTLVNGLLSLGVPLSSIDPDRPGIVHRLDKDTSGLLLVAKDDDTHLKLTAALKRRAIQRTYLALVRGEMPAPSGSVEAPIGRHGNLRRKMAVTPEGRDAVTHYRVLGTGQGASFLEVRLETGRTHQIRVHLAHLGHPVLGDASYGGRGDLARKLGLQRPFLHAVRIAFDHPISGEGVEVTEPLPGDLVGALELAGIELPHS